MGDSSFGSHLTNDGPLTEFLEKVEAHRIPDFAIFRLPLQSSIRKPPLPSAIVENKPMELLQTMGDTTDTQDFRDERFRAELVMGETVNQAREQLECFFEEYPLTPGEPDPLPKVYHMIIVGGWFHIEEVARDTWKEFPIRDIKPIYMFQGDADKTISSELLECWPELRFQESS